MVQPHTATTERPDDELRHILIQAIDSSDSFADRFDAEVWLTDMSRRLDRKVPDPQERLLILKTAHYEATCAELPPELVLAVIDVESNFDRFAVSRAGARGLMQVMPHLGGDQSDSLYVPAPNLRAGLRLLRGSWEGFAYLDSLDRLRFTLAAYHAGIGHVTDARRLAMDIGLDPNRWDGGLAVTLPRKAQRRWYTDMRHGYYRGDETVRYVEDILNRYRMYMRLVPRDPDQSAPSDTLAAAAADSAAFAAIEDDE